MTIKEQRIAEVLRDCMPEGTTIGDVLELIRACVDAKQCRGESVFVFGVNPPTTVFDALPEKFNFKRGNAWCDVPVRAIL